MIAPPFPKLQQMPTSLSAEGVIRIELEQGIPVLRAASTVQKRIQALLDKHHAGQLSAEEAQELDWFEEIDDYLSLLNRVVRNQLLGQNQIVS